MRNQTAASEVIPAAQFGPEQRRYTVLIYIGLPLFVLILSGLFVSIDKKDLSGMVFCVPLTIMWIVSMLKSARNIAALRKAKRNGLSEVAIHPMVLVRYFDGKVFESRDMRAMLVFVSFLYVLTIGAIVINLLGLA
jgi:hypothetical protein